MLRNEKGSAMIFAVIGFATIFIFATVFIFLGSSNAKQAYKEEKKTQAYYIAKAGAETLLKHAKDSGDMIATLDDLVTKTSSSSKMGEFNNEKFEIDVKKPNPKENIYHINSKSTINKSGTNPSTDWTRAIVNIDEGIIFPNFEGTIYSSSKDPMDITDLNKLRGDNLQIYTPGHAKDVAVRILNPEVVRDALASPEKIVDGLKVKDSTGEYTFRVKTKPNSTIIDELEIYKDGTLKVTIQYGYNIKTVLKEELERYDEQIKKYFATPYSNGTFSNNNTTITENINYTSSTIRGWTIDATSSSNREPLEIRIKDINILGNSTIKTSKYRDIVIVTDDFTMEDNIKLNVEGDGQLSILVAKNMQLDTGAKIDIAKKANVDIHLKPGVYFKLNDKSSINGGSIFGLGADVDLHGYSEFKGQIINETIGINDQAIINSFSEEELKDKHTREPRVYIEWERPVIKEKR